MNWRNCRKFIAVVVLILCQFCSRGAFGKSFLDSLNSVLTCPKGAGLFLPCIIRKKAESEHGRMLFVAGLEGTGHHAMRSFLEQCVKSESNNNPKACIGEDQLSLHMMTWVPKNNMIHGIFGTGHAYKNQSDAFMGDMKGVHEAMHTISVKRDAAQVHIVGLSYGGESTHGLSGMFSYPNYDGIHKALDIPDVTLLAALAESSKVDLRIIVLLRDSQDMLMSYVRRFQINAYAEALTMVNAMSALYTQLAMIDRKFYKCLQFESLGTMSVQEQDELITFIHPTALVNDRDKMFGAFRKRPLIDAKDHKAVNSNMDNHMKYLLWRLEVQESLLRSICGGENVPVI
jgi:hypothetical protein